MTGSRRAPWIALVAAAAVLPYLPGLPGEFVYDDRRLIVENEGLKRPFDLTRAFARDYYASDDDRMGLGYYRPAAILSNEFDYRRSNGSPGAFHATNILIHATASVLVFFLARRLFGGRQAIALPAAILFALHPCHAESVAFISGRVDPLATTFALAAMLLHMQGTCSLKPWRWRWAGAFAWLLALLSKEVAVTVPALLFLLESAESGAAVRRDWKRQLARYLPYVVVLAPYLAARWGALGSLLGTAAEGTRSSAWQAPVAIGSYLAWLVFPPPGIHLEPAPVSGVLAVGAVLFAGAFVVCAGLLARHGRGCEAALVGWCVVALLPVAQFRPIETDLSERFLYLPSVGATILIAALARWAAQRARRAFARRAITAALALLALAYLAVLVPRAVLWRDEARLWAASAGEDPGSLKAQLNLGHALARKGDIEGARRAYDRAIEIKPEVAAAAESDFAAAAGSAAGIDVVDSLRRGAAANPGDAALRANLGFTLLQRGATVEAAAAFRESVALVPTRSAPWLGLALAELHNGRPKEASEAALRALEIDPTFDPAKLALAECRLRLGDPCGAIQIVEPIAFDDPADAVARERVLELARRACPGS